MFVFIFADESATIRVTNLSEDTRESDLQELFRPFGTIQRIYLAKDKNTGQSKVGMIHLLCNRSQCFLNVHMACNQRTRLTLIIVNYVMLAGI